MFKHPAIIQKVIKTIPNKTLRSDVNHCKKKLPYKYVHNYVCKNDKERADLITWYGAYLVAWEEIKFYKERQMTLEDFLGD